MNKLLDFLSTFTLPALDITVGGIRFIKYQEKILVFFTLACKDNHLQILREMGLELDFSNKRVNMASNQRTVGSSGNTLSINCRCSLDVFSSIYKFFRGEFRPNMLNDTQLSWKGFGENTKTKFNYKPLNK